MPSLTKLANVFAGPGMLAAGINHFVNPGTYEKIMPRYIPAHREMVYASGVTEIAGGLLSLHPETRRTAGWISLLTLAGVFPVHVDMLVHREGRYKQLPNAALWGRIPLQLVMAYAIYQACLSPEGRKRKALSL